MLALIAAIIMSVPLDTRDYSVSVTAPGNFVEDFSIDTGSSLTMIGSSGIDGGYLRYSLARFQVSEFLDVYLQAVNGEVYRVPSFLVPHFRIGTCDLGTVQVVEGPKEVPNLLGMNVLTRVEHWHFDSVHHTFSFTCPTATAVVQYWN